MPRLARRLEERTEAQHLRDKIYSELRAVHEQCERLAHRIAVASAWLAELPVPDDRQDRAREE
jgi:hypothetical protein